MCSFMLECNVFDSFSDNQKSPTSLLQEPERKRDRQRQMEERARKMLNIVRANGQFPEITFHYFIQFPSQTSFFFLIK